MALNSSNAQLLKSLRIMKYITKTPLKEESDDPVVAELMVCVATTLKEKLYLFQYPNRPSFMPYDELYCGRIKPQQRKVELELLLDTQSSCYNQKKGKDLAANAINPETGESYYQTSFVDKHVLTSTRLQPTASYFCGVLSPGKLHLTPISDILQFRSSFECLNVSSSDVKENKVSSKPVGLIDKPLNPQERRLKELQSGIEEEWISLSVFTNKTKDFDKVFNRLFCVSEEPYLFPLAIDEYLATVTGRLRLNTATATSKSGSDVKQGLLRALEMPLEQRVRVILENAQIIHFSRLLRLSGCETVLSRVVLEVLKEISVVIHGCLIIRSDTLYPDDNIVPALESSGAVLREVRDHILLLFHSMPNATDEYNSIETLAKSTLKNYCISEVLDPPIQTNSERAGYLKRKFILQSFNISFETLTALLKQVAFLRSPFGWALKLQTDHHFIQRYPTFVEAHNPACILQVRQKSKL
ncbi:DNA-directed RNA polymerase III subunit RPC5-like [Zophobas morio]|uniref:DNA-directed RNA polymerase III subunit RPC5-like n=1 Tax=Zophobas morio TaxID=2755281 RepID=UPI00308386E3